MKAIYIITFILISNFIFQYIAVSPDYLAAIERSYFQGVAYIVLSITGHIK